MRKKNKNKSEFEFGFPKSKPESSRFGNAFNFVENKNQVRKKNKNKSEFEFGFPKSKAEPKPKLESSKFQSVLAFTIVLFLVASLTSVIHRNGNKNFGSSGDYNSSSELSEPQVQIAGEETVLYDHDDGNQSLMKNESESTEDETEKILSDLGFEKMEIYEENEPVKTFWKNDDLIFIQGKILRIASDAVTSSKINRHAIEAQDIDTNSITSRTIRDNTIKGIDIDEDTSITIESLSADNISAETITADVINGLFVDSGALSGITTINMSGQLTSTVANGTAPFVITSTTVNANLNADLLDGQHGSYYAATSSISGTDNYIPKFNGTSALENSVIYDDGTNIGIGTTSPETILHIAQEGTGAPIFERSGAAANTQYISQYLLATKVDDMGNGFGSGLGFQIRDNAGVRNTIALIGAARNGADNSGDLNFLTAAAGTTTERMRITSAGNVGIGTTSPGGKLDLLATSGSQLRLSYSDSVYVDFTVGSTGNLSIASNTAGATTSIGAGTDVAIKIDSAGNVGIGTTDPLATLDINGSMILSGSDHYLNFGSTVGSDGYGIRDNAGNLEYKISGGSWVDFGSGVASVSSTDSVPIGTVSSFPMSTCPAGWVEADGSNVSRETYTQLFTAIGDDYGSGDGSTTFTIPDYRGYFLRGWAHGSAIDPDRASRTDRGDGTGGDVVGSKQTDAFESHTHGLNVTYLYHANVGADPNVTGSGGTASGATGGNETRPTNINVLYCIKTTATDNLWGINDSDTYYTTGNVGIGATNPITKLSVVGNVSIGNVAAGTDGTRVLILSNGTVPSTSTADSIQLYSEDVAASSELKVRDEAGNITTLSPHNFSLIPDGRSEDLAWSYYSQRGDEAINVDMTKTIRLVEQLTGEQLIYLKDLKSGVYKDAQSEIETPLALELLENQKFSIDENADTIETLKKSVNEKLSEIELKITKNESDIDGQIRNIISLQEELQNQVNEMVRQNSSEGIGLVEARLGSMEMALNVSGSDVDILGSLSVLGNVNVLGGKIVAKDIEALGIIKAEEIQTKIFGITSEKVSDKAEIEAGSSEKIIETPYVSEDSKIYITIEGSNYGKVLYYDEVIEGESFKVKFDGDAVEEKIKFNWMIVK